MIKVVRGNPTPEELAAAVAVVRAAAAASAAESAWPGAHGAQGAGEPDAPGAAGDAWADPARVARTRLPVPGPRAWRRTFWPG